MLGELAVQKIILNVFLQNKIGSGKLMGPKGVSVDRNGHIIVVDNKACCVFIFQLNGKLVTKFGNRGNGDRQFAGTVNVNSPDPYTWDEDLHPAITVTTTI